MAGHDLSAGILRVYSERLAIPVASCPPNYYSLLGIAPFESDADTIKAAIRQRSLAIRKLASTDLEASARVVLQQVGKAKACLLSADAKAAYDQRLKQKLRRDQGGPVATPANVRRSPAKAPVRSSTGQANRSPQSGASSATPLHSKGPPPPGLQQAIDASHARLHRKETLVSTLDESTSKWWQRQSVMIAATGGVLAFAMVLTLFLLPSPKQQDTTAIAEAEDVPADRLNEQPENVDGATDQQKEASPEKSATSHNPQPENEKPVAEDDTAGSTPPTSQPKLPNRKKKPPSQKKPVFQGNPFESLPSDTSLPPIKFSKYDLVAKKDPVYPIGPIGGTDHSQLQLAIAPQAVSLDSDYEFYVEVTSGSDGRRVWEVRLRVVATKDTKSTLGGLVAKSYEAIARFFVNYGKLQFAWVPTDRTRLADQLRNRVLQLRMGPNVHEVRLRKVQRVPAVVLDFDQHNQSILIEGPGLPNVESLQLEILDLDGFAIAGELEPSDGIISGSDTVRVKLKDWEEAEIRFKFFGTEDELYVRMTAYFKWDRKWRTLTTEAITKMNARLERSWVKNKNNLAKRRRSVSQISREISSLRGRRPSNQSEAMQLSQAISQRQGMLRTKQRNIASIERSLP